MRDEHTPLTTESKSRQQREDLRRMAFRRAIEARVEARRLENALADFPETPSGLLPDIWSSRNPMLHP